MRAYVNELALAEACATASPEQAPLAALVEERQRHHAVLGTTLFCAGRMPLTQVRQGLRLRDLGQRLPRDTKQLFFAWTSKRGPFIEDNRQAAESDFFVFGEDEVTDLGLGEAARRVLSQEAAAVLSPVRDPASRFADDPLVVVQGLPDEVHKHVDVPNFLDVATLAEAVQAHGPEPTNWPDALSQARQRFNRLWISDYCDRTLSNQSFRPPQYRRMMELLKVLQTLMEEMNHAGELSPKGKALHQKHFVGDAAWFSDESDTNKRSSERYIFPDPAGSGTLTCFWHGKIRSGGFRMHFEWPPVDPRGRLRIVYIGRHR